MKTILKDQAKKADTHTNPDNEGNLAEISTEISLECSSENPACAAEVGATNESSEVAMMEERIDESQRDIGNIIADPDSSFDYNEPVIS